jgi:hypothetical protein
MYEEIVKKVWQMDDDSVTNIEWKCDKCMMKVWQILNESVTSVW